MSRPTLTDIYNSAALNVLANVPRTVTAGLVSLIAASAMTREWAVGAATAVVVTAGMGLYDATKGTYQAFKK